MDELNINTNDNKDSHFYISAEGKIGELQSQIDALRAQLSEAMDFIDEVANDDTPNNIYRVAAQMYKASIAKMGGENG